jgi:hypothetical protein
VALRRDQGPWNAVSAASTAACASAVVPRAMSAQVSPVYGSSVGRYSREPGGTLAPSM